MRDCDAVMKDSNLVALKLASKYGNAVTGRVCKNMHQVTAVGEGMYEKWSINEV